MNIAQLIPSTSTLGEVRYTFSVQGDFVFTEEQLNFIVMAKQVDYSYYNGIYQGEE